MGVKGGMVIIVADDPSCHSSQNEQDTRRYSVFSQVPCLEPSTPQQAKDMIPYAFELSEKYEIPVIFRSTTRISHGKSDIELAPVRQKTGEIKFEKNPDRWVMVPKNARVRHPHLLSIQQDIRGELEVSGWNELSIEAESTVGIIACGTAAVYAKEALERLGITVSFLKIGTYPIPEDSVRQLLAKTEQVIVIEELEPVIEDQCKVIAKDVEFETEIFGKADGLLPRTGEFNVDICMEGIAKAFGIDSCECKPAKQDMELPVRPPAMCAGCSHRGTFHVMKKVFGEDAVFPSDIGCYTLGIQHGTVDTTLCMGASISVASGIYDAGEKKPICCTIGDSTFFHTGINSLMNAIYNKSDITVLILDNRTTAMTGHQPNPGMGKTATREPTVEVAFDKLCSAMGAEFVEVVDPYDMAATEDVLERAKAHEGVSVVIAKRACVISAAREGIRYTPFMVDTDLCKGCRKCLKFGCPAIEFDENSKKAIINSMCSGCGLCAEICTFNAIVEVKK
jgi:indolepyruvate ferredoxin oxidoreductase alpha subunit